MENLKKVDSDLYSKLNTLILEMKEISMGPDLLKVKN
jgi:hypothetical protein